ncbi:MAG: hypothetical protein J4F31_08655 [Flavobacteriales bacterium]|nr:hypothetical protein [Flavobacteriales bacterium]
MKEFDHPKTVFLEVSNIISHGKQIAANGEMRAEDGTAYSFADFYELLSAGSKKLRKITSPVVKHS